MPEYQLVRPPRPAAEPLVLDAEQEAVVAHGGGPLLVLAGPGTGKTTTIVEAVVARIAEGADPESLLVLTFSRRAAGELRERITARLGRVTKEPLARTFHSYAFGLLRREAAARGEPAPRLLSGPEQDLVVRELLAGDLAAMREEGGAGRPRWPERLRPALRTRGFAQELRDLMMRAYERGLTPEDLARLGRRHGRDDWAAAARFMKQYAEVTALRDSAAYDPAELIRAVVSLWRRDEQLLRQERGARAAVFVDEMQDTDPAQLELLRLLCGGGRDLIAVGDPDQSIYGFRGADPAGVSRFAQLFPRADGSPAPVLTLTQGRRSGPALVAATRRVAAGLGGLGPQRRLRPAGGLPDGSVEVAVLRSQSQEAQHVAATLREAHLRDGVPWSAMAVLVRSTVRSLPVLHRALTAAGVPVVVAREELPLVEQPAVRPLLRVLEVASQPEALDEPAAVELLTSPLGGADVIGLRRLRQALRRAELAAGGTRASGELLVEVLAQPAALAVLNDWVARPATQVARVLTAAREAVTAPGATAEDVLWAVWSASGLGPQWERRSGEGGQTGATADRNLDAVVALFESAARFCDRLPAAGPQLFLEHLRGQQIPADTLAPRAPTGEAVHLMTAHAAKGLEWDLVCVAGVQEGVWPDLRLRGSFLGTERLVDLVRDRTETSPDGLPATLAMVSRLLAEERRLFYVAATRARRWLYVTGVTSEREGLVPSRFLDELQPTTVPDATVPEQRRAITEVSRPATLPGLVAELRRVLLDREADPQVRRDAADELAALAAAGVHGADPESWWGLLPLSDDRPVRDPDELVPVSPSRVETFLRCELRWFLEQVGGGGSPSASASIGTLVHAVAEGALDAESSTEQALLDRLEELWPTADLGRGWAADKEHAKAQAMVRRLAGWLAASSGRRLLATEHDFQVEVGRALITGQVDRLERDAAGRAVVIDLKTGSAKVEPAELDQHGQLAAYQLAAEAGAFADLGASGSGGAMLVQLGKGGFDRTAREQAQPPLSETDDPGWANDLLARVAAGMAGSAYAAMANKLCPRCPVRTSCPVHEDGRPVTA